ncbi:hypothetical protein [Paenibacillus polysaccharolyticus]|uniref:hypothetical protein n=1 Tax=Paenibacillus polysaccharolyticus TaxID=582692 RepID=UPI00300ACC48
MLIEKAKGLIHIIDELVNTKADILVDGEITYNLSKKLEYEEVLILQSIMYIGQQEQKPDPQDFSNFYAYEEELKRYRPERLLEDYMRNLGAHYEAPSVRLYSMLSKRPVREYLQKGLNILGIRHEIKQIR